MNKLYGLLTYNAQPIENAYWDKQMTAVFHTDKSRRICAELMLHVPTSQIKRFACMLCGLLTESRYWSKIQKLDPANTYFKIDRSHASSGVDPNACIYSMTIPHDSFRPIELMLDEDLRDELEPATWLDLASAACLQMLREVSK